MITTNILIENQTFNSVNTYNPDTPDNKTDGQSVLCFSGPNFDEANTIYNITVNNCVMDGGSIHWGSKQSLIFELTFNDCVFKNGDKRAFDMVRGGIVTFNNCKWINDGSRPKVKSPYFTLSEYCDCGIKGGVRDIVFNNCSLNDVLLGDWTIYDQIERPKTRRVTFNNCTNPNGGGIIVRGRYFESTTIQKINTKVNAWTWPSFVTSIYWMYNKKFGDTRKPTGWDVIYPLEKV